MEKNTLRQALRNKVDNLNKPKGSLGRLESLAIQIGMVQDTLSPRLSHPCHILFGGDHGIEKEGVSFSPREVTWQQMINYTKGGGGVNMFCRQHGFKLKIVDMGVDYNFPTGLLCKSNPEGLPLITDRKIAHGTRNFLHESAMTYQQWLRALEVGAEQVDECFNSGCNIISFGEMGIANTSPSSILMHLLLDISLDKCVGAGSGLDTDGIRHKYDVLRQSVEHFSKYKLTDVPESSKHFSAEGIYFCGFEMAAAIGGMLQAAKHRMIIIVDGFIMSACMLVARSIMPEVMDFAVFGHCGDEGGHKLMLESMEARPLLNLGMRLGEGTGAICAYPIIQSAVNMINEMDNFSHANITKYF